MVYVKKQQLLQSLKNFNEKICANQKKQTDNL